jgi:hypothetical protein
VRTNFHCVHKQRGTDSKAIFSDVYDQKADDMIQFDMANEIVKALFKKGMESAYHGFTQT